MKIAPDFRRTIYNKILELPEDKMLLLLDRGGACVFTRKRERERETSGGIVQGSIQFNEARRRDKPDAIDCSSPRIVEPKPMSRWDRSTAPPPPPPPPSLLVRRGCAALDVV